MIFVPSSWNSMKRHGKELFLDRHKSALGRVVYLKLTYELKIFELPWIRIVFYCRAFFEKYFAIFKRRPVR